MDKRPTVVSDTVFLPHPPRPIFNAVMSPEIAPKIDPGVRKWEPDRRPIGLGTEFDSTSTPRRRGPLPAGSASGAASEVAGW